MKKIVQTVGSLKKRIEIKKLHSLHATDATKHQEEKVRVKIKPYRVRPFSKVLSDAKALPPAIRLFGDLIYKNEVTLLAGDTGVGKSMLVVDIAIGLAKGSKRPEPFINESEPVRVLYIDYELTDRQFSKRFHGEDYPENLSRVDGEPDCDGCNITLDDLETLVVENKCELLILDNITTMASASTKDPEIAIKIMKELKRLQKKHGISIIAVAHTPKRYDLTKPLEVSDVAGSKMITNYADSVLFIANSTQGKNIRYLKQVKQRNTEMPNGVFEMEVKENEAGVYFEYTGMGNERDHLKDYENVSEDRHNQIVEMIKQGLADAEIADHLGINRTTVWRTRKKM